MQNRWDNSWGSGDWQEDYHLKLNLRLTLKQQNKRLSSDSPKKSDYLSLEQKENYKNPPFSDPPPLIST